VVSAALQDRQPLSYEKFITSHLQGASLEAGNSQ
jgi:hypothetical protein